MKKSINLFAVCAVALLYSSCDTAGTDDKNDVTPIAKTRTELITAGKWQTIAATDTYTKDGQVVTVDEYESYDACDKDDFMLFKTDYKLINDAGPTKCDPTEKQTHESTWAFIDNETKVVITFDLNHDTINIDELTETSMKVSYSFNFEDESIGTGKQTFKRID